MRNTVLGIITLTMVTLAGCNHCERRFTLCMAPPSAELGQAIRGCSEDWDCDDPAYWECVQPAAEDFEAALSLCEEQLAKCQTGNAGKT